MTRKQTILAVLGVVTLCLCVYIASYISMRTHYDFSRNGAIVNRFCYGKDRNGDDRINRTIYGFDGTSDVWSRDPVDAEKVVNNKPINTHRIFIPLEIAEIISHRKVSWRGLWDIPSDYFHYSDTLTGKEQIETRIAFILSVDKAEGVVHFFNNEVDLAEYVRWTDADGERSIPYLRHLSSDLIEKIGGWIGKKVKIITAGSSYYPRRVRDIVLLESSTQPPAGH